MLRRSDGRRIDPRDRRSRRTREILENAKPYFTENAAGDPELDEGVVKQFGARQYLAVPLITILHSPFQFPKKIEADILRSLLSISSKLVVMTRTGLTHMVSGYGFPEERLAFIRHGAPVRKK